MTKETSLEKILNELSNNEMFRLSLGSKELFHSNYWAYLLQTYPEIFKNVFYPDCSEKDKITDVNREMDHTDISFKCNKDLIIIENKCKDQPKIEQIVKYLLNKPKKIILISFFEPNFNEEDIKQKIKDNNLKIEYQDGKYQHISYDNIYKKMYECTKNEKIKDNQYFKDYLSMLKNLVDLKKAVSLENKTYQLVINEIEATNKIADKFNFSSFIKKITLNELGQNIRKDIKEEVIIDSTYCNYSHGVIFIDLMQNCEKRNYCKYQEMGISDIGITFTINDTSGENLLRHYIGVNKNNKTRDKIEYSLRNENFWFFENCRGYKNKPAQFRGFEGKGDDKYWLFKYCQNEKENYEINLSDMNYDNIKELVIKEFSEISNNAMSDE